MTSSSTQPPIQHDEAVWRPRPPAVSDTVGRYSRFVGWMRIGLPTTAAILILLVFIVPQFRGDDDRFRVGSESVPAAAVDTLSMVNARYFGTDAKGQPFSVTAKGVRERSGNDKRVELTGPQADISLNNGTWLSVDAATGLYDSAAETLDLRDEVNLYQDQGYEMHTAAATVNMRDGEARSRTAVDTQGPFGHMTSAGFDLYEKGDVVVFTGPAHLVLSGSRTAPQATDPTAAAPSAPDTPRGQTP